MLRRELHCWPEGNLVTMADRASKSRYTLGVFMLSERISLWYRKVSKHPRQGRCRCIFPVAAHCRLFWGSRHNGGAWNVTRPVIRAPWMCSLHAERGSRYGGRASLEFDTSTQRFDTFREDLATASRSRLGLRESGFSVPRSLGQAVRVSRYDA